MKSMLLLLIALLASAACVAKETVLFVTQPVEREEDSELFRHTSERVFSVELNVRGLAENGLILLPDERLVRIDLPGRAPLVVAGHHFNPVAGFVFDERGDVIVDPKEPDSGLSYYWYGRADNAEVTIYFDNGVAAASIRFGLEAWVITTAKSGAALRKLDPRKIPEDIVLTPPPRELSKANPIIPSHEVNQSTSSVAKTVDKIDVLVVYTGKTLAEATESFGGGISAAINLVIQQTNTAFMNSGMTTVLLSNVNPGGNAGLLVPYGENPGLSDPDERWSAHLTWVEKNTATLRNTYQADIVSMIVFDPNGHGGMANVQTATTNGESFSPLAFSTVSFVAALSPSHYAFAHELGHNLGMNHDLASTAAPETAVFSWSFGHLSQPAQIKDIMAYLSACNWTCSTALQYSNPEVSFIGYPSHPSGRTTPDPGGYTRFNAKTGAILALPVSEYRGHKLVGRFFRSSFEQLQR